MSKKTGKVVVLRSRPQETREQVLERLFKEHQAALRGFLKLRMGGSADVDDIIQDVFIRLSSLPNLRERLPPGNDSNRAFLFTIANNLVVDLERARRVRRHYAEEQQARAADENPMTTDLTPEAIAQADQQLAAIKKIIMGLKPQWREAFILHRFQHKSYRQIAQDMDVTVKQVEWFVKSAITHLQKAAINSLEVK